MINILRKLRWFVEKTKIKLRKKTLGLCEEGVEIYSDSTFIYPKRIFIHKFTLIMPKCILMASGGNIIVGKYCSISLNFTVVTSNHKPTVGIPVNFNNSLHINDEIKGDVIIEDDVWIGIGVTLLAGAKIGRGAIVGANSMINKEIPPYAVVVGSPAKIIAVKFSKQQILEHETAIYPESERLTSDYLDILFNKYYEGAKNYGVDNISKNDKLRLADYYKKRGISFNNTNSL